MKEVFELIKERLKKLINEPICLREYDDCCDGINEAIKIVSEVEAEYGNGWIPFSERLPEKDAYCLVTYESGKIGIMEYLETSKWGWNGEFADNRVIAWMPLPSPYTSTTD